MTRDDVLDRLQRAFREQTEDLVSNDYEDAIDDALLELGWTLPNTDSKQCQWIVKRSSRHLMFLLYTGAARKFKVDGYSLHQRFEHYSTILTRIDAEFQLALDSESYLFSNAKASEMFGFLVGSGFKNNVVGENVTHSDDNEVPLFPNASS